MTDYDPHSWVHHLLDIKGSMVRQIFARVLSCFFWSAAVVGIHEYLLHRQLGSLAIAPVAHTLIGVALGLLLVFRTNASYDRFWEGRRLWGSIINESRNLGRSASVLLAEAPDLLARLLRWTMVFAYTTMHRLRGDRPTASAATAALPLDEVGATFAAGHVPLAVARRMSEQLQEARQRGQISDYVQMTLDNNVQLLIDYMGGCERIHRSPLPFAYVVHLRRALILYCFSLPFALLDSFGWGTLPATLLLAYTLLGIEEIGVQIEDPFGRDDNDLPLERFCATIEKDLTEMLPGGVLAGKIAPTTEEAISNAEGRG